MLTATGDLPALLKRAAKAIIGGGEGFSTRSAAGHHKMLRRSEKARGMRGRYDKLNHAATLGDHAWIWQAAHVLRMLFIKWLPHNGEVCPGRFMSFCAPVPPGVHSTYR